jgi:hypothetical protein
MGEPKPKSGLVNELFADPDLVAFDKLYERMIATDPNFVPFDPELHSCHGAIIQFHKKFFAASDTDRYATFKNAIKGKTPLTIQTIRFAQWRAELKLEKTGRVVVTRSLRVNKKEMARGGSPMILVIHPGLNNVAIPSHLDEFKKHPNFKENGEWLEYSEELEMCAKNFSSYVDVFCYRNKLEQLGKEYL